MAPRAAAGRPRGGRRPLVTLLLGVSASLPALAGGASIGAPAAAGSGVVVADAAAAQQGAAGAAEAAAAASEAPMSATPAAASLGQSARPHAARLSAGFLWESPLSCALRVAGWLADSGEQRPPASAAISLIVGASRDYPSGPFSHATGATLFGGIPVLLLVPVLLGIILVVTVQLISMYFELRDPEVNIMGHKIVS
mmetsp:Transcript_19855/g.56887  ORF Transcript_19855/g.56887 Transcript_19855/m.56887 type:complete len:197 (-) Transcript_19855:54-644(-)